MTIDELAAEVGKAASDELGEALIVIKHCLDQLTEEEVWWRPAPLSPPEARMNSIGNLMLHLHGNIRQWLVAGLDGPHYDRARPQEFAEQGPIPKAELLRMLEQGVQDAQATLMQQTGQRLVELRRPQYRDVSGLGAMFHSVSHFRGHTQEIVHITRTLLGRSYKIRLVP